MLKNVRDSLKGVVAWVFVILLILAFALWGVPSVTELTRGSALSVGGKSYSAQYIQNEFTRAIDRQRRESGGSYTRDDAIASGLDDQVISSIATGAALDQFAEEMRFVLPREIVSDFLRNNDNFKNPATGEFDETVLRSILQRLGVSAQEFERRINDELTRDQMINALVTQGPAPRPFVEATLRRESEKREISYLVVTDEMAGKAAEPTPDDLSAYYQANPAIYTSPEYRTFDLAVLRFDDFREGLETPEEELKRLYEVNRERLYEKPELRTLYQVTYNTEAEAQATSAALRRGEPFENIAEAKGLSLDAVTFSDARRNDILDTNVAEAAFADGLEAGFITDPIESLFGWTVVQIAGVTAPEIQTYEDVRDEIETSYLEQDTRRRLLEAIDEIEDIRDSGAGLAAAADSIELAVTSIGPVDQYAFAPGGAIIDKFPVEVLAEVFDLEEGEESEAIRLNDESGYYFVALNEVREPALIAFEDVRNEVVDAWRKTERASRIGETVSSIREKLASGATLEATASEYERAPVSITLDRRFENEEISSALRDDVFYAELNGVVSGDVAFGESQIVATIDKIDFSEFARLAPQISAYEQYIGFQIDQELVDATITAIQDDIGVKTNAAQLEQIFAIDQ